MSRFYEEVIVERDEKKEALLDLPRAVASNTTSIEFIEEQIEELHLAHQKAQKWQSRVREYVLGGLVGALIGIGLSRLL